MSEESSLWLRRMRNWNSRDTRDKWGRNAEFILSCIGYCVGFGNIWRFPYVVYKNGGAAFFFPYVVMLLLLALPVFMLECYLGQFSGCTAVSAFNFAPACKGIGIGMTIVDFYISVYYIAFIVYSTKYLVATVSSELPWTNCNPDWGADDKCFIRKAGDVRLRNWFRHVCQNANFWKEITRLTLTVMTGKHQRSNIGSKYVLVFFGFVTTAILHMGKQHSLSNLGSVQLDLLFYLFLSWFIQYLLIFKGIKSSGKFAYFSATFPFLILFSLLINAFRLEGSTNGLKFLFMPKWIDLIDLQVWRAATIQVFFSTGIAFGCLILYSSYNRFHNKIQRSVFAILFADFFASLASSMSVFAILGFLANELKVDIDQVVDKGPGLIFIAMPEAITKMPIPHIWSFLYFLMLYNVGANSLCVMVDTLLTTIYEEIPRMDNHKGKIRILTCFVLFVFGIPCATNGGIFVVDFLDLFSTDVTLVFFACCEIMAVAFIYGLKRFSSDMEFMLGSPLHIYWKICWWFINPFVLIFLLGFGLLTNEECEEYTTFSCFLGWLVAISCLIPVPIVAIYYFWIYLKTPETWRGALRPVRHWGPREFVYKVMYLSWRQNAGVELGPRTRATLAELELEIMSRDSDMESVLTGRLADRRYSFIRRFSNLFLPHEIEQLEKTEEG